MSMKNPEMIEVISAMKFSMSQSGNSAAPLKAYNDKMKLIVVSMSWKTRNTKKYLLFFSATQLPIQGQ